MTQTSPFLLDAIQLPDPAMAQLTDLQIHPTLLLEAVALPAPAEQGFSPSVAGWQSNRRAGEKAPSPVKRMRSH